MLSGCLHLSGGERQRVADERLSASGGVLFDEPLSNLDAKLRLEMRRDQGPPRAYGATTIYVRDVAEALTLGRIAVPDRGRLQQVGTPGI
jgi:iron(III) transport system ATP-binding protein